MKFLLILLLVITAVSCSKSAGDNSRKMVDPNATDETRNLYKNLGELAREHTLFGHQHATEYGHGWAGDS